MARTVTESGWAGRKRASPPSANCKALGRAGLEGRADHPVVLKRPDHEPLLLSQHELPPLVELDSYRRRSA